MVKSAVREREMGVGSGPAGTGRPPRYRETRGELLGVRGKVIGATRGLIVE